MNGKNLVFASDPFGFASLCPINPLNMRACNTTPQTSAQALQRLGTLDVIRDAYFDLEPVSVSSQEVNLRAVFPGTTFVPQGRTADTPIHCYWVPYRSHGVQGVGIGNVPYVDLPTNAPLYPLMLTGAMNGCSLVITIPNGAVNSIRVYHDSMHQAATFAGENVVARLDFDNSLGSPHFYGDLANPTSFNFMYFKTGHWWVVSQPQTAVAGVGGSFQVSLRVTKMPFEFQVT
jgi:hypothetical protein